MRFDNSKFRSLNETISHIDEPEMILDEYTELLESVLLALCDELELDPNELMEYRMTPKRSAVLDRESAKISRRHLGASPIGVKKDGTYKWSKLAKKDKPQYDADVKRMERIRNIHRKVRKTHPDYGTTGQTQWG